MILCLDLETTGLSDHHCGIIQIAACWLHGGEFFRECSVKPSTLVEEEALKVNGHTKEQIFDRQRIPESLALGEFLGWVRGPHGDNDRVQIAAWNTHFDYRFLITSFQKIGIESRYIPFLHHLLDVHSLIAGDVLRKRYEPLRNAGIDYELTGMVNFGGDIKSSDMGSELLDLTPEPKPHNALSGARQVRAMLRRFLGNPGALPGFSL